jgi:hypothetical protein
MKHIIAKVRLNKINGQKLVTVPKDCNIVPGDTVELVKVKISVTRGEK